MKKTYNKPTIEIEVYSLNTSIANNCKMVVSNGPQMEHHQMCDNYIEPFSVMDERALTSNVAFYDDLTKPCDCYYTATEAGYWTS